MKKLKKFGLLAVLIAGLGLNNNSAQAIDAKSAAAYAVAGVAVGGLTAIYSKTVGKWLQKNPETIFMAALGFSTEMLDSVNNECMHGIMASTAAITCCMALIKKKSIFAAAATTLIPYYMGSELARQIS